MANKNKKSNNNSFWKNGISIDEAKVSSLIICLLSSIIFAGLIYIKEHDISNNLTDIIQSLILGIAGINIADKAGQIFTRDEIKKNDDDNDMII